MNSTQISKLNCKFAKIYNKEEMICMLMEESAELIQACNKYLRYVSKKRKSKKKKKLIQDLSSMKKDVMSSLIEEIADTEIFIERIKLQLKISDKDILKWKASKLKRQKARLKEERRTQIKQKGI